VSDDQRNLARAALGVAATRATLLLLGTVASVVVARVLGPAGRGQYAFVVAVAAIAIALGHASIEQAQVFLVSTGRSVRRLAANAVAIGLSLGTGVAALLVLSSAVLGYPSEDIRRDLPMLLALAAVPVSMVVLYANGLLVLEGRTDLLNRGALLAGIAQVLVLGLFAATGRLTVTVVVAAWLLNAALPLLVSLPSLRPRRQDLSWPLARRELATGMRYHGGLASLYLMLRVDILILAALTDDAAVGLYALAVGLIELTNIAADAVATVVLRRQTTSSLDDAALLTARVVGVTVVLAGAAAAALAAISPLLVPLVYGRPFSGAVPALLALAPGVLALAATRSAGGYLVRLDRPWLVTSFAGSALAVNVALNLALIPTLGIVGAGIASSISYLLLAGAYLTWLVRAAQLPPSAFRPRIHLRAMLRR
jgi:O-antigen/teichoic acid export membrane protein